MVVNREFSYGSAWLVNVKVAQNKSIQTLKRIQKTDNIKANNKENIW